MPKAAEVSFATWPADGSPFTNFDANRRVVSGQLQIDAVGGYPQVRTPTTYDLTSSYFGVNLVAPPNASNGSTEASLSVETASGDGLMIGWANTNLFARRIVGGVRNDVYLTYDPVAHKYMRFRESAGTVYWEASPTGVTWSNLRPPEAVGFSLTTIALVLLAGNWNTATSPGTAIFGAVNSYDAATPVTPVVPTIANPERGFFYYTQTHAPNVAATTYDVLTASGLSAAKAAGQTLVFRYIILDQFLNTDTISQAFLNQLSADLTLVRNAGMKIIPRFAYSNSGKMDAPPYLADPPVARVLTHISQLAGPLNANADIVDSLQQGFIGMWGEQYYTDNFGDKGVMTAQNWTDRKAVINSLLDNLDSRIFVQVRYVGTKRMLVDEGMPTAKLNRIGFHNDAFLAPSDDYGTFHTFTPYTAAQNMTWLEQHMAAGRYPMGGESADLNGTGSQLPAARIALAKYRWTYLNPNYHPDVLTSWQEAGRTEVGSALGYNFTLSDITASVSGSNVMLGFTVTNSGYAAPYRSHPVLVDFVSGTTVVTRTMSVDIKNWVPGTTPVTGTVLAPSTGTWSVHLRIVDPSSTLQTNVAYNIRVGGITYDTTTGRNALDKSVTTTVTSTSNSFILIGGTWIPKNAPRKMIF